MRLKRNPKVWIGLGLFALVMLLLLGKPMGRPSDSGQEVEALPKVATLLISAQPIRAKITLTGHTEAARKVTLRSEIQAKVSKIITPRGASITEGQILIQLEQKDIQARLKEAQARLHQREMETESGTKLAAQSIKAQNKQAATTADLETARALLAKAKRDFQNLNVKAPFDGVLENHLVEVGDFVAVGEDLAQVVELNPLLVKGDVTEKNYKHLKKDGAALINLPSLGVIDQPGIVTYISKSADPKTRTYCIHIRLDNPESRIPDGLTAQIMIEKAGVQAHQIPSSTLTINDAGVVGVKLVEEGKVVFYPVEIVDSTPHSLWVSGLLNTVELIHFGGGFVEEGQAVITLNHAVSPDQEGWDTRSPGKG